MKQDSKRCSGRTLGLALQSLGKAIENPGTDVVFTDHHTQNHAQLLLCKQQIEHLAKTLNLDVTTKIVNGDCKWEAIPCAILVKSNWVSPYAQRTPAEEKWKEIVGRYPDERDVVSFAYFKRGFEEAQND